MSSRWPLALIVVGFLALGTCLVPAGGWDDAYMTFWPAGTLADSGRMVNYNGEYVEQSSTMSFVLAIAIVSKLTGLDPSMAGRVLSVVFGVLALIATARLGERTGTAASRLAPAIVATCTFFVYWSFGGMEASLAALAAALVLLSLSAAMDRRVSGRLALTGLAAIALYLLSRPESVFVLLATAAGVLAAEMIRRRDGTWPARVRQASLTVMGVAVFVAAAMASFRFWYFGRAFPQPVYAKSKLLSRSKVTEGLDYFIESLKSEFVILLVVAVVAAIVVLLGRRRAQQRTPVEIACAAFLAAHLAFVLFSGGDGMHGGRFFVPAIPAAAVLATAFAARRLPARVLRVAVPVWIAAQAGGVVLFAATQAHSDFPWAVAAATPDERARFNWFERANHDHRRYFQAVVELERAIDRLRPERTPVVILSGQSGFVMTHLARSRPGAFRYMDRFSLVTRDFIDCVISKDLPKMNWGLQLTIVDFLERRNAFAKQCGIPMPDIIYEIFWGDFPKRDAEALAGAGFRLLYVQDEIADGRRLSAATGIGRAFVAARLEPGPTAASGGR